MRSSWLSLETRERRGEGLDEPCSAATFRGSRGGGASKGDCRGDGWEEGGKPGGFQGDRSQKRPTFQKGDRVTVLNAAENSSKMVTIAGI